MNLPKEDYQELQKQWAERANVLTQVRNQVLMEAFKALTVINAGGAAALGAFVQAVWDKPGATPMLRGLLCGIGVLLSGTAVSAVVFVARHLSPFHPKTTQPFKNPFWWTEVVGMLLAIVLFIVGMGTAVYSASRAVPLPHWQVPETAPMIDFSPTRASKLDWTAIFTAMLFVATCGLWWATRRLVKGAGDTAIRQLRAYVSVLPSAMVSTLAHPPDIHAQPLTVAVTLKNHGLTPARQVHVYYEVQVLTHPRPPGHKFPMPTQDFPNSFALAPAEDTPMNLRRPKPLSPPELEQIREDTARIYFWGMATYSDVFNKQRQTEFCTSVVGGKFLVDYLLQCYTAVREGKPRPSLPAGMLHPFNFDTCDRHGDGT